METSSRLVTRSVWRAAREWVNCEAALWRGRQRKWVSWGFLGRVPGRLGGVDPDPDAEADILEIVDILRGKIFSFSAFISGCSGVCGVEPHAEYSDKPGMQRYAKLEVGTE